MSGESLQVKSKVSQNDTATMNGLTQVPTHVTLSAEQFERLYLNPMTRRPPTLTKNLGNPTPLAVGAFVITATPIGCCLMGWRGAGGGGAAFSAVLILFGGLLLVLAGIMEFIIGNTFPSIVFSHLGAFCLAFGATLTPAFNAAAPYSPTTDSLVEGLVSPGFLSTYAYFFLFMGLLMFIYAICSLRTNACFFLIFVALIFFFTLLAGSWWQLAQEHAVIGERLQVGSGASLFAAAMIGYYLLAAQLFDSVGLPFSLPIGDFTKLWAHSSPQHGGSDLESNDINSDK